MTLTRSAWQTPLEVLTLLAFLIGAGRASWRGITGGKT